MKNHLTSFLGISLMVVACNSDPKMSTGMGNGGSSDSGTSMTNPDSGSMPSSDAGVATNEDAGTTPMPDPDAGVDFTRDPTCPMEASWITTVSGKVTDEMGGPLQGAWAQLCLIACESDMSTGAWDCSSTISVCLPPADSIGDGTFEVLVPEANRCLLEMTMRNLQFGEDRATMYCHLDLNNAESAYDVNESLVLYPTIPAPNLPAEGDKAMTREVEFASGLSLSLAPSNYYGDYALLAAAPVSPQNLCFVDDPSSVDALYAFSPEGTAAVDFSSNTIKEIGVKVPVPANAMAAPGDKYKMYVLGGLGCPDPQSMEPGTNFIKEGDWSVFSTGTVDMTGTMIESEPGSGIPCLTWIKVEKE